MKSPSDRKIPISRWFHFGAKLSDKPGFEISHLKSPFEITLWKPAFIEEGVEVILGICDVSASQTWNLLRLVIYQILQKVVILKPSAYITGDFIYLPAVQ